MRATLGGEISDAGISATTDTRRCGDGPTEGEVFDVLANRRRRFALHALGRERGTLTLGELAEQIAAWENGTDVSAVSSSGRKRVYTALQQSHLPRMDEAGMIEFDKRAGTVGVTDATEDIDVYLDVVRGREIPWSAYYVGLSGLSAAILLALWVGAPPLSWFPSTVWLTFVVLIFAVSSVAHFWVTRRQRLGAAGRPPEVK